MRVRILAVLVTLFGLVGGCVPKIGGIQVKQSGISSSIQPRVTLEARSSSGASLSGVAELKLESITINTTQVPVYLDKGIHKGIFGINDEASKDAGEKETDWKNILDIQGLLPGEDMKTIRKLKGSGPKVDQALKGLWARALEEGLDSAGITYGAEVALTVTVNSVLDNNVRQTVVRDQPFFKVENLLLCTNLADEERAEFVWRDGKDMSNLIESDRHSGSAVVALPLSGVSLFELEITVTEKSNISDALKKAAEALEKASEGGKLDVSGSGLAGKAAKAVLKYFKKNMEDLLEQHEATHTFRVYLRKPDNSDSFTEGSFAVSADIPVRKEPGAKLDVKFRDPLRKTLLGVGGRDVDQAEQEIEVRIESIEALGGLKNGRVRALSFTVRIRQSGMVYPA